jgi:hypothetical protein
MEWKRGSIRVYDCKSPLSTTMAFVPWIFAFLLTIELEYAKLSHLYA